VKREREKGGEKIFSFRRERRGKEEERTSRKEEKKHPTQNRPRIHPPYGYKINNAEENIE
jgi:hypothetical protein